MVLAYLGMFWDDVQPATIRYEIDYWQNTSWGLHAIDRSSTRCESAVSSDGSRMHRCESADFRHFFVPRGQASILHTLYEQPTHSGYRIDEEERIARGGPCQCSWTVDRVVDEDDGKCLNTVRERLPTAEYYGTDRVADQPVVRYRATDDQGAFHELALAPGLSCQTMEETTRWKGTWGIPGASYKMRITEYRAGEPSFATFQIPPGYRMEDWPLRRFDRQLQ